MILLTFSLVPGAALAAGFMSRRASTSDIDDYLVGGRSFGPIPVFVLGAGEAYSIGTLLGFPGGVYAFGSNFGVWFIAYILLAYPIGYWLAPYLWQAGKRYGAMTLPDAAGSHFRSRTPELTIAISSVIFLIPPGAAPADRSPGGDECAGDPDRPDRRGARRRRVDHGVPAAVGRACASLRLLRQGRRPAPRRDPRRARGGGQVRRHDRAVRQGRRGRSRPGDALHAGRSLADVHDDHDRLPCHGLLRLPLHRASDLLGQSEGTLKRAARFNPLYMLMYPFLGRRGLRGRGPAAREARGTGVQPGPCSSSPARCCPTG
ncbi:sodium:solute symporter family transporter [Nocardioides sp. B-3]|uniref:sodium:solute symporter family transporter n=1 Tax=Nocardioides sp. B-3 TaxID=2895565 RepID=UPI0021529CD1|nr:hypothetical protein [Nocardioides sp. B-3]UUZ59141.1 hypothetical protein LP418_24960 [Nocardioides sp. B-3]